VARWAWLTSTEYLTSVSASARLSEHAPAAMRALREYVNSTGFPAHFPVEVRFAAGDAIWMSPAYGRPTCFIGIIMYRYGRSPNDRAEGRRPQF